MSDFISILADLVTIAAFAVMLYDRYRKQDD